MALEPLKFYYTMRMMNEDGVMMTAFTSSISVFEQCQRIGERAEDHKTRYLNTIDLNEPGKKEEVMEWVQKKRAQAWKEIEEVFEDAR